MDGGFFLKGVALGFSIAAPVGPIGVLCIRRTLSQGRAAGLATGLGAATADGVYGGIAAFGLTVLTRWLVGGQSWLRLLGGAFLIGLGIRTFLARPADQSAVARAGSLAGAYGSTLLLTLTNPMTILSFVALFAGTGAAGTGRTPATAALLVLGVFLGSALWWLVLSAGVGRLRARVTPNGLQWVNRVSGAAIGGFGIFGFVSGLHAVLAHAGR